jgi:hypothetical protein
MKNDKLMPGLILVLIGAVILLDNFGYIDFHWTNLWHLWPMFLIIAGVNLVFANNRTPLATIAKIAVVVIGFGLLLFGNFGDRMGFPMYYSFHNNHDRDDNNNNDKDDDDDDDDDDSTATTAGKTGIVKVESNNSFNAPYAADAKIGQLNISGAATEYLLSDTTNQLFKADTKEHFFGKYEFSHRNEGSTYILDFKMKDKKGGHFDWGNDNDKSNSAIFKLNPNPIWDIKVETGATSLDFDLTKFKIRTLTLSGGAASFKVKLGMPLSATNVVVSTGMASVDINIPQNAACRITTDSGLSSTDFDGFTKKDDGTYETTGYETAVNKLNININGGMSGFKVNRY